MSVELRSEDKLSAKRILWVVLLAWWVTGCTARECEFDNPNYHPLSLIEGACLESESEAEAEESSTFEEGEEGDESFICSNSAMEELAGCVFFGCGGCGDDTLDCAYQFCSGVMPYEGTSCADCLQANLSPDLASTALACSDLSSSELPVQMPTCLSTGDEGSAVLTCEDVGFEGCCQGNKLLYCENNEKQELDCPEECGYWNPETEYYQCANPGQQSADPSGTYPLFCPNP